MANNKYVISVKRVKNYSEESLSEDRQYFEYAGIDNYSGYPCFLCENHAERFNTEELAVAWWERNKKYLLRGNESSKYDLSTLAVRKIYYRKIAELTV